MNDFEQKLLQEVHEVRLELTEVKGDIRELKQEVKSNGEKFDDQTDTETKRLDKHSGEIDDLRDGYTELKTKADNNWKWFLALAAWATAIAGVFAYFS